MVYIIQTMLNFKVVCTQSTTCCFHSNRYMLGHSENTIRKLDNNCFSFKNYNQQLKCDTQLG